MVDSLLTAARHREELSDPVVEELEAAVQNAAVALETAEAGWEQSVDHAEMLDRSRAVAEKGWAEAVTQTEALGASLARAETGWAEAAEAVELAQSRIGRLSQGLAGLDAQLVSRIACWRSDVAGPAVTAEVPEPDRLAEYDSWLTRAADRPEPTAAPTGITFSILIPVYNPPAALLEACIRSVRAQTYGTWELVLIDGSDAPHVAPICDRFAALDSRIRIVRHENLGISANTNLAAEHATGNWYLLVDHDDELAPHALAAFAEAIEANGDLRYGYSDEDKIDEAGRRSDPFFKPDWSPDLLRTLNYITHLQGIRRDLWEEIGGLRPKTDGAQDYDLALRASAAAGGAFHIADVLYHWRVHSQSTAGDVGVKPHAHRAGRRALEDYAQHHAPDSWIEFGTGPTSHRFRYPVVTQPLSVIIPFRDGADVTETCLTGIARFGTALPLEVLLINNQSSDPQTHERIAEWQERYSWVRVLRYDEPFNFQKLNNWAAEQATGELLLFLNNDTEPFHEGWVEALAEHAQRPEVGAVGGRLFYPNGIVQHAGVAVGIGGYAEHPWAGLHPDAWTPAGPSYWTRNFLSVTAACLMVQRSKFEEVGGFDERFTIGGGDVALGLALRERGYWNVMTPYARLIHHESVTRGTVVPESDLLISRAVYEPFLDGRDPFYNSNLTLEDTRCGLR
jgi:GT2 family glycosyltransferase